jgi:uncharacterized cupin superfamily protein
VVPEAPLKPAGQGVAPAAGGWFVLNARDARWLDSPFGAYTTFNGEGEARFEQVGFNIGVLQPGQPNCRYHREDMQEDFLVLAGECVLLIEGQERRLEAWDFVHCPPGTDHVFVGAGDGPCVVIGVGARPTTSVVYAESELAQRYGAGVQKETNDPREAYADVEPDEDVEFQDDWLPS